MKRKILSLLSVLMIIISTFSFPQGVSAASRTIWDPGANYTLTGNKATDLVAVAMSQNGYYAGGSGYNSKYGSFTGTNGQAWCASFVSWCANKAGIGTDVITKSSSADAYHKQGISLGRYYTRKSGYKPVAGDIVLYDGFLNWNGIADHVGIVRYSDSKYVYTIEGNTSIWKNGKKTTTHVCATHTYALNYQYIMGYYHPNYPASPTPVTIKPVLNVWVSNSPMGSNATDYLEGSNQYLCYKITDANTGKLLDQVVNKNYTVTMSIKSGSTTLHSGTANNDNNWIGLTGVSPASLMGTVTVSGDIYGENSVSWTVKASVKEISPVMDYGVTSSDWKTSDAAYYTGITYKFGWNFYDLLSGNGMDTAAPQKNYNITLKLIRNGVTTKSLSGSTDYKSEYITIDTAGTYTVEMTISGDYSLTNSISFDVLPGTITVSYNNDASALHNSDPKFDAVYSNLPAAATINSGEMMQIPYAIPEYFGCNFNYYCNDSDTSDVTEYIPGKSYKFKKNTVLSPVFGMGNRMFSGDNTLDFNIQYSGAGSWEWFKVDKTGFWSFWSEETVLNPSVSIYDENKNLIFSDDDSADGINFGLYGIELEADKQYWIKVSLINGQTGSVVVHYKYSEIKVGASYKTENLLSASPQYQSETWSPDEDTQEVTEDFPENFPKTFSGWSTEDPASPGNENITPQYFPGDPYDASMPMLYACFEDPDSIYVNKEQMVSIDIANSTRYLKFVPELDGEYTFECTDWNNIEGALLINISENGVIESSFEENGRFLFTASLTAGETYYLSVRMSDDAATGTFHVLISGEEPPVTFYTVNFDKNGHGDSEPTAQTVEQGGLAAEPSEIVCTTECYRLEGWYTDKNGSNRYDFSKEVTGDLTLYAKWIPNHLLAEVEEQAPTCVEEGNKQYWECLSCGKLFQDEAGSKEILPADTVIPATGEHIWDEGRLTDEKEGIITYTCTVCGETKTEKQEYIPVSELTVYPDYAEVATGSYFQLETLIAPENASDQQIFWESSDDSIASVDSEGRVKAKKYGIVTITAETTDGLEVSSIIQTRFKDVNDPTKVFYEPVYWAVDNNITKCTVRFKPTNGVTRGEFVAFLYRMSGSPEVTEYTANFSDVNSGTKFYKEISWGVNQGIIKGFSDGTFRPEDGVTRGQTAIMIWRWAGRNSSSLAESPFSDVQYAKTDTCKAILWGSQNGIIKGYSDKTFRPSEKCTRANAVTFLYRYAQKF